MVLATSIAETSLTVPGVRIVVDGGWRRAPRLDPSTGLTRLATLRISRAAAEQRAGRAGREAPGVAIRLWTPALHRGLAAFDRPEILEAELSVPGADLRRLGHAAGRAGFPGCATAGRGGRGRVAAARAGRPRCAGAITATGSRMAELGAHPRLAAMLLAADSAAEAALAAILAALLEERDPLRGPRAAHRVPAPSADISARIAAIVDGDPAADRGALSRIRQAAAQYRRRLRLPADTRPAGDPGRLLAAGFPDRIAQRRGEPGSFRLSGGGGARLPRTDKLANATLLAVAALEMRASAQIRLAAPLDPDALPAALAARVTETTRGRFRPRLRCVLSRRRRRLGMLVLSDRTLPADPNETAAALARAVAAAELRPLPWTDAARQFQARAALMRRLEPGSDWPDLSDTALRHRRDVAPAPPQRHAPAGRPDRLDLTAVLRGLLPCNLVTGWTRSCRNTCLSRADAPASTTRKTRRWPPPARRRSTAWTTPRRWPAAASAHDLPCCPPPDARSPSPPTWPSSGAAAGRTRAATCAAATRSTCGRTILR